MRTGRRGRVLLQTLRPRRPGVVSCDVDLLLRWLQRDVVFLLMARLRKLAHRVVEAQAQDLHV